MPVPGIGKNNQQLVTADMTVKRYHKPKAEDDFIDIDALLRNVTLHTIRESVFQDSGPWAPTLDGRPELEPASKQ